MSAPTIGERLAEFVAAFSRAADEASAAMAPKVKAFNESIEAAFRKPPG